MKQTTNNTDTTWAENVNDPAVRRRRVGILELDAVEIETDHRAGRGHAGHTSAVVGNDSAGLAATDIGGIHRRAQASAPSTTDMGRFAGVGR
jgi:hypothetical protein